MMTNYTEPSKSSRTMKSIALDGSEGVQQSQICRHFSIRGYVSEIQKINRNICWPFGNGKLGGHPDLQLPPMIIPEFKWWACKSCQWMINRIESAPRENLFPNPRDLKTSYCNKDGLMSVGRLSPIEEGKEENEEHQGMEIIQTNLVMKSRDDDDVAVGLNHLTGSNKSNVDNLEGVKSDGIRSNSCQPDDLMSEGQLSPIDEDEQENEGDHECNIQVVLPAIEFIETDLHMKSTLDDDMAEGLNDLVRKNKSGMNVMEGIEIDGIRSNSCQPDGLMSEEKDQEEKEEQPECSIQVVLPHIEFIKTQFSTIGRDDDDVAAEGSDNLMKSKMSSVKGKESTKNDGIRSNSCKSVELMFEGQLSPIEVQEEKEKHPECNIEVVLPGIGIHLPTKAIDDDDDVAEGVDDLTRSNKSDEDALKGIENDNIQRTSCQTSELMSEGQFSPLEENQEKNKERPECIIQVVIPGIQLMETHLPTKAIADDDVAEGVDELVRSNKSDMEALDDVENDAIRSTSCQSGDLKSEGELSPMEKGQEENEELPECNIQVVLPGIDVIETHVSAKAIDDDDDDDVAEGLDDPVRSNKSDVDVLQGIKNNGICSNSCQSNDLMLGIQLSPIEENQEEKEEPRGWNVQVANSAIQSVDTDLCSEPRDGDVTEGLDDQVRSKLSDMDVLEGILNDGIRGNLASEGQLSPIEDPMETEEQRECSIQVVDSGIQSVDTDLCTKGRNNDDMVEGADDLTRSSKSDVDVLKGIWSISCQPGSSNLYFSRRRKKMRRLADILKSQLFRPSRETSLDKNEFSLKSGDVDSLEGNPLGDEKSALVSRERKKIATRKIRLFSREERAGTCSNKHLLETEKPKSQNPDGVSKEIKRLEDHENINANISRDIVTDDRVLHEREAPVCIEEVNDTLKENESSVPVVTLNGEEKVDASPVDKTMSVLDDVSTEILEFLQTNFQRNHQQNSRRHNADASSSVAINKSGISNSQHQKRHRGGHSPNPGEAQRRKKHRVKVGHFTPMQNQPIEAHLNLNIIPRTDPCLSYSKINCLSGSISPNRYEYSPIETLTAMQLLRLVDPAVPLNVQHVSSFDSFDQISMTPPKRSFNSSTDFSDVPALCSGKKRKNKNHGSASQKAKKSTVKSIKFKEKGGADDLLTDSQPKLGFCALNMNPADFYTINRRSKLYMISYKDLIPVQTRPVEH